jgi:uncharacterized membrane protein
MMESTNRVDAFTDAAFAFAVSLLVIGGAGAPSDLSQLTRALADIPAFAFGFAIIALFWLGHMRWRKLRGAGDSRSLLLTLMLVFLTLIYVQPLRGMAAATGLWFTGQGAGFKGSLTGLFAVYGTGFVAMSLLMAALFSDALRNAGLTKAERQTARGEQVIWVILSVTGLLSIAISFTRYGVWAAMVYATLPLSITLFVSRFDWSGEKIRPAATRTRSRGK